MTPEKHLQAHIGALCRELRLAVRSNLNQSNRARFLLTTEDTESTEI